eukprot:9495534-Pyramimonas_sp.AAC.1
MAETRQRILLILLVILGITGTLGFWTASPSLSERSLLLAPTDGTKSTVRLWGYNGCFNWTGNNLGMVAIVPEYLDLSDPTCSTSVLIHTLSAFQGRRSTFITARDARKSLKTPPTLLQLKVDTRECI